MIYLVMLILLFIKNKILQKILPLKIILKNTDITIIQLPNVVEIIEDFIIENNYELKIITNTNKLKNIGGHFRIVNNLYLRQIDGFTNLKEILTSNNIINLGCETSDFLSSCKRGFVIKNNWNLSKISDFINIQFPDDKMGDKEYFLIMNNPQYDKKEITNLTLKRRLWENLKFKINKLEETNKKLVIVTLYNLEILINFNIDKIV